MPAAHLNSRNQIWSFLMSVNTNETQAILSCMVWVVSLSATSKTAFVEKSTAVGMPCLMLTWLAFTYFYAYVPCGEMNQSVWTEKLRQVSSQINQGVAARFCARIPRQEGQGIWCTSERAHVRHSVAQNIRHRGNGERWTKELVWCGNGGLIANASRVVWQARMLSNLRKACHH